MASFDLMSSEHFHVILHPDKKHGLIFNRMDDTVATINYDDAKELTNLSKIDTFFGIVGRFLDKYLVLIKDCTLVGHLYEPNTKTEHEVFVITQVHVVNNSCISKTERSNSVKYNATLDKTETNAPNVTSMTDNSDYTSLPVTISSSSYNSFQSRPWNPFKLANSLKPKIPTQFLRSAMVESLIGDSSSVSGSSEDSDKRLIEEMSKLFNNTNSFYFSPTLDLTNRFSRESSFKRPVNESLYKKADNRFFWNKHMVKDLIELDKIDDNARHFICVILQGFIMIEHHVVPSSPSNISGVENVSPATSVNSMRISSQNSYRDTSLSSERNHSSCRTSASYKNYQLALVSRRSVFQAGTRYRRRGCDDMGNCANFVETEQIFRQNRQFTSVVILRGSIPLYWYQTGFNYRPPPVLCRSEEENHLAFAKHFKSLIEYHETDRIVAIDCTEQSGREKDLHDAYKSHMKRLKSSLPNVDLIEFDFHKYCRGRQCSDIQVEKHLRSCGLTDQIIKDARYYWNDGEMVCKQNAVFRVNCLDCSDRTNVVQRAIALQILDIQLSRLGVLAPDTCPEDNEFRKIMQVIWSSNGNVLSTQYCGTGALFGGNKRISGYLKDTYSSASRYYISKFRDAYRQAAIDAMLGVEATEKTDQNTQLDQYELVNYETGSSLLKNVDNGVNSKLPRLRGVFDVKPFVDDSVIATKSKKDPDIISENSKGPLERELNENFSALDIDWPSSESVVENDGPLYDDAFAQLNCEDNYQDDELGQLMLSIDLAELQRLRDDENNGVGELTHRANKKEEIELSISDGCVHKSSTSKTDVMSTTTST